MSKTVTATITYADVSLPPGTEVGQYVVQLLSVGSPASITQSFSTPPDEVEFLNVGAGTYTMYMRVMNTSLGLIGDATSAQFTVTNDTPSLTVKLPQTIVVEVN